MQRGRSIGCAPTEPAISRITKITPCTHIPVFLGDRAVTRFRMKLDYCSEASRSRISRESGGIHIVPQSCKLRPPPAEDFEFTACNHTRLPAEVCVQIGFIRQANPGSMPNFTLTVYVMAGDSGFDDELHKCLRNLRSLRMIRNLCRNRVQFEYFNLSQGIKLSTSVTVHVSG